MNVDIRWIQRFRNYSKALEQLKTAVELANERELSDLEKQGVIQAFEFTHELAWNVVKDFYENRGTTGLQGSRDAVRLAFQRGLIRSGDVWMDMIESRNKTSRTYDENTVRDILNDVCCIYYPEFRDLYEVLSEYVHAK